MSGMFGGATAFNNGNAFYMNWNVTKVTNFYYMFANATSFNAYIVNWTTSSAQNMYYMFYYASSFGRDLRSWDVARVTGWYGFYLGSGMAWNYPSLVPYKFW